MTASLIEDMLGFVSKIVLEGKIRI